MDKSQSLHSFWSSFGIPAYDSATVPDEAVMPYITYDVATDHFDRQIQLTASIWYRSTSWAEITQKADVIAQTIGDGGKVVKTEGGYIYFYLGSPFAQRMADEEDTIRRIYLMVNGEYLTACEKGATMGRFTIIPESTFNELQMDAGILLKEFNPDDPDVQDEDIITATTGGISISCTPSYSDFGADVDNCPNNTKELKHLDGWDCSLTATALGTSPELIKWALGAADIDGTNTSMIVPRRDLEQTDFADLWWVGDRIDGGFVAVKVINALSTAGFSIQTTKNGKGQTSLTIGGHVSINDQSTVPMEFYSMDPEGATGATGATGA